MMYLCVHKCSVKLMKTWNYLCGRKLYVSCFSMYVCPVVLNILCYKETILTSKSTYYCTSQKLNNASRNLDYLIANLHEKHKYKDKTGTNYKKKTEKLLKCHPKMFQPKVDKACDDKLVTLLMMNEPEKAAGELEYYSIASLYPSKKTLKRLVKVLTSKGNVEEVRKIQVICEQVYPNECKWNIGFRHYVAEALWRNEQYEASVQLFESILFEYPHKRIKVSNMITCLTDHLIERNLEKELDLLVEMVKHCDINHVVADVWKRLFLSDLVRHQRMGQSILDEYPNVKVCVCRHFESIISTARELQCISILQRLVEVSLQLETRSYYSEVFSSLLEIQCATDDLFGAMETFRHVYQNGIVLKGETCYKFVYFLGAKKLRVPQALLQMKYGPPKPVPHEKIKFPF